jgi:AcrB/AcrD/AcrF family protein
MGQCWRRPKPVTDPIRMRILLVEDDRRIARFVGSGAELLQPLAIAVIGGLAVALLLSLVVTPTVYAMLSRERPG